MININEFKVEKVPGTVYYIPNFVSAEEEQHLLNKVYKVPKPKWTQLSNRRLQNWGGVPHPKGMLVELIPEWLSLYLDKVWQLGVFKDSCKPNHVLVNEYLTGQGIMPHFDGPLFYPTITTLSLGSHTVLDFYLPRSDDSGDPLDSHREKLLSLLIEPRSLLILQDDMYCKYLHGIEEKTVDIFSEPEISNWYACEDLKSRCGENSCLHKEDVIRAIFKETVDGSESLVSRHRSTHVTEREREAVSIENSGQDYDEKCKEVPVVYDPELSECNQKSSCTSGNEFAQESVHKLERGTRISLTMRHVPKTSKVKIKLGR